MQQADFAAQIHADQSPETMSLATCVSYLIGPIEKAVAVVAWILVYYTFYSQQI
jgi:hypothetical protein